MINSSRAKSAWNVKISYVSLMGFIFVFFMASSATAYGYQPVSPQTKRNDGARTVPVDKSAEPGFIYRFEDKVLYSEEYNIYMVGQHCYRGGPIRFDPPVEHFTIFIGNKEHQVFGRSVWDNFYIPSDWNFILRWIDAGYWFVSLNQDSCADVFIDTRYETAELLQRAHEKQAPVTVRDKSGNVIAKFTLIIN